MTTNKKKDIKVTIAIIGILATLIAFGCTFNFVFMFFNLCFWMMFDHNYFEKNDELVVRKGTEYINRK